MKELERENRELRWPNVILPELAGWPDNRPGGWQRSGDA